MVREKVTYQKREVSCRVTRSILKYLELHGYSVEPILAGLPYSREYLSDPLNWINYEYRTLICQRAVEVTNNQKIMFEIGLAAPELNSLGGMEPIIRLLSGPRSAYKFVNRYSGFFDRGFSLTTRFTGANTLVVTMQAVQPYAASVHSCNYAQGVLAAIPKLWKLPPAEVVEAACMYKSLNGEGSPAEACVFNVRWKPLKSWWRRLIDRVSLIPSSKPFTLQEMESNFLQSDAENIELRLRNAQLSTIREMALALDSVKTRDQVYQTVVETARNIPGVRFVALVKTDNSGENITVPYFSTIRNTAVAGALKAAGFDVNRTLGEENTGGVFTFPKNSSRLISEYVTKPVVISHHSLADVLDGVLPHTMSNLIQKTMGIIKITIVPVIIDGESWGAITFMLSELVPRDILEMAGAHCAIALKNTHILEELEQRNAELNESEQRYRRLAENAADIILRLELDPLRFTYISPSIETLTGRRPVELYTLHPRDLLHPDDLEALINRVSRESWQMNVRYKKSNDEYITLEQRNVPLFDSRGRLVAIESIARDISERFAAQQAIADSEQRYHTIFNSTNDILILIDIQGRIIDVNNKIREFGYSPDILIGQHIGSIPDILPPASAEAIIENFNRRLANLTVPPYEVVMIRRNGQKAIVEINAGVLYEYGQVKGDLAVIRDITERKAAEQKIKDLYQQEKSWRQELQEEARARAMFIDILAHELRTPLTPMLITAGVLTDLVKTQPEVYQKLAATLMSSASSLAARLEELLEVARYARGAFRLKKSVVDITEFVNELVEKSQPAFEKNQQKLAITISENCGQGFFDAPRLEQVLLNLLTNAGKFSPQKSRIELILETRESWLHVEVIDQGTGVSQEDQKRLFQPYHRFQQDRSVYPGTGLGLAVCKQIIEAHGGSIWYRSGPGDMGSIFGFDIPLE